MVLHTFNIDDSANPLGGVIFDRAGNLYGSTSSGGRDRFGVIYENIPNRRRPVDGNGSV